MPRGSCVLTVATVILVAGPVRADPILLVASPEISAPLARALGDAGLDPAPEAPPEPPSRVWDELSEAGRAFAAMDPALALRILDGVRAELDLTGGGTSGPAAALRVELLSALALAAAGRPATEVDRALQQALAIVPEPSIDPVEYPPWLLDRVATLARTPAPRVALELRGAAGADAFVDGTRACVLPCVRELPAGVHRVRVQRAGRLPFTKRVDLGAATVVEATARPDVRALTAAVHRAVEMGQDPDEALSAFDKVLWATVQTSAGGTRTIVGTLFAANAPRRGATVEIAGSDGAALERASRNVVTALTAPQIAERPDRRRRRPRETAWYARPWVWIAAGAVVVAGGVAVGLAATSGAPEGFNLVVQRQ